VPWPAEPIPGGYCVRDATGQALAFVYSRETEAEARRIAANIARLYRPRRKGVGAKPVTWEGHC
jgi:hypothetical protein